MDTAKEFTFTKRPGDPVRHVVRYVVTATRAIREEEARTAFENYIQSEPHEVRIRFDEWFEPRGRT
jgi:hypothetical protein